MSQEEIQKKYMEYQMLQQQMKSIEKQMESVDNELAEVQMAINSLNELAEVKESETLVPINSGIYAKARLSKVDNLVVNIGAGVMVEKDVEATKKLLNEQLDEITKVKSKMSAEMEKSMSRFISIENELKKLVKE